MVRLFLALGVLCVVQGDSPSLLPVTTCMVESHTDSDAELSYLWPNKRGLEPPVCYVGILYLE